MQAGENDNHEINPRCPKCSNPLSVQLVGVKGYYKKIIEASCAVCGHLEYLDAPTRDKLMVIDMARLPENVQAWLHETTRRNGSSIEDEIVGVLELMVA